MAQPSGEIHGAATDDEAIRGTSRLVIVSYHDFMALCDHSVVGAEQICLVSTLPISPSAYLRKWYNDVPLRKMERNETSGLSAPSDRLSSD